MQIIQGKLGVFLGYFCFLGLSLHRQDKGKWSTIKQAMVIMTDDSYRLDAKSPFQQSRFCRRSRRSLLGSNFVEKRRVKNFLNGTKKKLFLPPHVQKKTERELLLAASEPESNPLPFPLLLLPLSSFLFSLWVGPLRILSPPPPPPPPPPSLSSDGGGGGGGDSSRKKKREEEDDDDSSSPPSLVMGE